jgi:2-keto-4-pentenoate hydratase/2-oxohepta-3-ene-1,7-dioic acid hydratase in catechol pathway
MRLARRGRSGAEVPVVRTDDGDYDLRPITSDIDGGFLAGGGIERARAALAAGLLPKVARDVESRWAAPIARPGKVVCIGLNYRDHADETGATLPSEPVVFMKDPYSVVGAFDDVLVPRGSFKTDWEVELAVVIGRTARYLADPDAAVAHIAGYAISNDVSERAFQLERGGQWDKGKSCETFNPLGPVLVTADEVPDPQALGLRLWVNGDLKQSGSTADMVFGVAHIVWYLSQFMVLYPGDLINTGTPAGVALGSSHPRYLEPGDVIDLEIDGLGAARQEVRSA